MASRLELHEELCNLLDSRNVYFQPPESLKMKYPCIRYSKTNISTRHANDRIYLGVNRYDLVVIDPDPDSVIPDELMSVFPMCSFDRSYTANNLNHFSLTLYY